MVRVADPPKSAVSPTPSLAELEDRVRKAPRDANALVALARMKMQTDPAASARALRKAIRLNPRCVDAYHALAEILKERRYIDREIETLEQLLRVVPNDPEATARLANLYVDSHEVKQGEKLFRAAIAAHPDDAGLQEKWAAFCYRIRKFAEGIEALSQLVTDRPKDDALLGRLSELQRADGRYDDAEGTIRVAIKLKPSEGAHVRQLAHTLVTSEKPARLPEAEAAGRQAVEMMPGDEDALYWLALSLDRQGKSEEAIKYYERVSRIDITYERTAFRLGQLYQNAGRAKEGDRLLRLYNEMETNRSKMAQAIGLVREHPERVENYINLARILRLAGDDPNAIVLLRRAARRFPGNRTVDALLAKALIAAGRLTEAKAVMRRERAKPNKP